MATDRVILRLNGQYKGINPGEVAGFSKEEAEHLLRTKLTDANGNERPAAVLVEPAKPPAK